MSATLDPILIVDDEKDNLQALQRLLRKQYEITVTTSPFEALKLVQMHDFHIIVSDQRMPEMNGVELLEKVKNVRPGTARILLTGYTDIDSVIGAINRGNIYRYVAKPWDPEDLKLTLRQANEAFRLRAELDRKNAELSEALEALKGLDRAKARFLSLVSHELNTPLTVLTSFVSLLAERVEEVPADVARAVGSLGSASSRFSEIVGEVLTYVRLEAEDRFERKAFDLRKETLAVKAALKKQGARLNVTGDGVVLCDPEQGRVALRKLLADALLRAPQTEPVAVSIRADGDIVVYSVSRGGEKVSPDVFTPFETSSEEMHHHRNLGLSLAICKLILERHGAPMTLDSSTKSTTITVRLPKSA